MYGITDRNLEFLKVTYLVESSTFIYVKTVKQV